MSGDVDGGTRQLNALANPVTRCPIRLLDLQSLDAEYDRILNETFATTLPTTLCHYTDWDGLEGILTSKVLWATDFRNQATDAQEFQHADETIIEVAKGLAAEPILKHTHRALLERAAREYPENAVTRTSDRELFITSFCENPDNSKVWRTFGREGKGYAIEFEVRNEKLDQPSFGVVSVKVDYRVESVRARLTNAFCQIFALRSYFCGTQLAHADMYTLRSFWMIATRMAAQHKSVEHAPDREWRRLVFAPSRRRYDEAPAALPIVHATPKIHVKVPIRRGKRHPKIRAIYVGRYAVATAEKDVAQLLARAGFLGDLAPPIRRLP